MKLKILFLVLFLLIVLPIPTLALEWDNVKSYNTDTKTITIINAFDIPLLRYTLAEYTLDYNTDQCLINCEARGTAKIFKEEQLFSDLNFYDKKEVSKELNYNIYIQDIKTITEEKENYTTICKNIISENKTIIKACTQKLINNYNETKKYKYWKEYKGENLKAGNYNWKIQATKPKELSVDWIASAQGKDFKEWAWWNTNWAYKKELNITEKSGTNLNSWSVLLNVSYDSDMNSTFSDLRFLNSVEDTEIGYWIESKVDSSSALIWLYADQLTANINTTFYMYYGNAGASTTSNIKNAFYIADDFSTNTSSLYTDCSTTTGGDFTIDTAEETMFVDANSVSWYNFYRNDKTLTDVQMRMKVNLSSPDWVGMTLRTSTDRADLYRVAFNPNGGTSDNPSLMKLVSNAETKFTIPAGTTTSAGIYYTMTGHIIGTSLNVTWPEKNYTHQLTDSAVDGSLGSYIGCTLHNTGDTYIDYYWARNYSTTTEPTYSFSEETIQTIYPTVILNTPTNNTLSNTSIITFNCSVEDNIEVVNITLYLDAIVNYSQTFSGTNDTSIQIDRTLSDGNYNWTCVAYDDENNQGTTNTWFFSIDTTAPVISLHSPTQDSEIVVLSVPSNVTLNYSVVDLTPTVCWYNTSDNTTLIYFNCNTVAYPNFTIGGYKTIYYWVNDSVGLKNNGTVDFVLNTISYETAYTTPDIEEQISRFYLNITASNITQSNASLQYNNSIYPMLIDNYNGTFTAFYYDLTLPKVDTDTTKEFNYSYFVNENEYNTNNYSQLIYNLSNFIVSANQCSPIAIKFNMLDEGELTNINGSWEYNFKYGLNNNTYIKQYGSFSDSSTLYICINETISPVWYMGTGEIFYRNESTHVNRRYYLFSNTSLSNSSQTNITIYDLLITDQTSFKLTVEDTSLNPYENVYASLIKWYPDLNEYNVVDMGKTDETGSTIIHVKTEDVDYRIGVYEQNGTLIKLADPIRMICLTSPCTYTLQISPTEVDYTTFLNIEQSLTFNRTLGIWYYLFSDPSQKTTTMNLTVHKLTGTSSVLICDSHVTGYVGAITCNTSGYTGTLKAEVTRVASPPIIIVQKIVQIITTPFKSTWGLFLSIFLAIPIIFILAAFSPVAALIGGVLALLPAYFFGSITIGIVGGIAVLAGIVAHFLKRIK